MEEHAVERFPLAGKWHRRLMILFIFLLAAWVGLGSVTVAQFALAIAVAVLGAAWALAELYSVVWGHGFDYVELLPDEILLALGLPLWRLRIRYEAIASADLKDRWSDRMARALLRNAGRSNPPRVELRFRRRLVFWWIWRLKRMYFRPTDPQVVMMALSARLGTA